MNQVNTFSLGASPANKAAPVLPEPLDTAQFHTRAAIREYQAACEAFYEYQRQVAHQAEVVADQLRAKELAQANLPLSDTDYDDLKRKEWQAVRDKESARISKEKTDALDKVAYMLSSPLVAEITHRSELHFLLEFQHWSQRGYTLEDDGLKYFQPGFYLVHLTAPAKKVSSK